MAGKRLTKDEWHQLITEFESGNESTTTFCQSCGISTSNFYKQRKVRAGVSPSAFVAARRVAPSASLVAVQIDEVVIRCDTQTPVAWVSDLVAALRG